MKLFTGLGLLCSIWMCVSACDDKENVEPGFCDSIFSCSVFGSSCQNDVIIHCLPNADGCLIATMDNCRSKGEICVEDGDGLVCSSPSHCVDDEACAGGRTGASMCCTSEDCDASAYVTCSEGADGCLDANWSECPDGGLCADLADGAQCLTASGLTCTSAIEIPRMGMAMSGKNFVQDFAGGINLTDADGCLATENSETVGVVFSISLKAGERLLMVELGGVDVVMNMQAGSCDVGGACLAVESGDEALDYTAATDELLFVVVENNELDPPDKSYDFRAFVNPECSNGVLEPGERCDDGNEEPLDGCDAECFVEFDHQCDHGSPTVCTKFESLGSFGVADTIPQLARRQPQAAGAVERYLITFTEELVFGGTLDAVGTGDYDFILYNEGGAVLLEQTYLGESWFSLVPAGTYVLRVDLWDEGSDSDHGYVANLTTSARPTCSDGKRETTEECDDGNLDNEDGCDLNCEVEFAYECDESSPSVCSTVRNLGSFGVGETIPDVVVLGPQPEGTSDRYTITFRESVVFGGALTASGTGDYDFVLSTAAQTVFEADQEGNDTWSEEIVPAGTYMIEVNLWPGTVPSDLGYTLAMTVAELPICGDGLVDFNEDCDDGNTNALDGCDTECAVEFDHACNDAEPTVCSPLPSLGSFAVGEAIDDLTRDNAMTAGTFEEYVITFTDAVELSGSLVSLGSGDYDFYVLDSSSELVFQASGVGDDSWAGEVLPAGSYLFVIQLFSQGGDADHGYRLTLSTNVPTR